jgi:DNA adenine methylase
LKIVGIKTRLIKVIARNVAWEGKGRWIEPCLGSGVVLFNLCPRVAIAGDINPHVIAFYSQLYDGKITTHEIRAFLTLHSEMFKTYGADYYAKIRNRFNDDQEPLYFLLLSRTCFNGLIRFNKKGQFNAPFCNEPYRLTKKLILEVTLRANWVIQQMARMKVEFVCGDFKETLKRAVEGDYIYLDPPYSGRFTGYYDQWGEERDTEIVNFMKSSRCGIMVSTWKNDAKADNPFYSRVVDDVDDVRVVISRHKYIVGAKAEWREGVMEALLIKDGLDLKK